MKCIRCDTLITGWYVEDMFGLGNTCDPCVNKEWHRKIKIKRNKADTALILKRMISGLEVSDVQKEALKKQVEEAFQEEYRSTQSEPC